ncbi:MAG: hypothetical protein JW891_17745 [Candidatus Lokiarchaeota archaeon]|nr:hypothetical protein [Candidatus Lokiarchaeota archaeon]
MTENENNEIDKTNCEFECPKLFDGYPGNYSLNQIIDSHGEITLKDLVLIFQKACSCRCVQGK